MKTRFQTNLGVQRKQPVHAVPTAAVAGNARRSRSEIANLQFAIRSLKFPQTPRSGVALVATLIMLSLVTFMVVAFLSVARRERQSVAASLTINEARAAMEAGLGRAQADIAARLLTLGDPWSYGLMVPTNYQNSVFNAAVIPANISPTNVNDVLALQAAGQPTPWLLHLGNLQYDPRAPVFSTYFTNRTPYNLLASETNLGRYYLDFNRDTMFESTDSFQTGDPQWISMLEYPGVPHSATNQFTSRYTYLVAPVGKTMDLNFMHNQSKRSNGVVTAEGYLRNLGVGPHELNLSAMLTELNPFWIYNYNTGAGVSGTGTPNDAFTNALRLVLFRNNNGFNNLDNLTGQFGAGPALNLASAQFDVFGDGPLMAASNLTANVEVTNFPRPGGNNTNALAQRFFDLNELFMTTRGYSATFQSNLNRLGTNDITATPAGDASRRTYYNLLSTLGVESWPQTDKLNLNWLGTRFLYFSNSAPGAFYDLTWSNAPSTSVGGEYFGFVNWTADEFFNTAAERMLRASITPSVLFDTNWTGFGGGGANVLLTNYYFGNTFVGISNNATLSVTNIPIFPASYYTPEVHRILQLAANIYDATTTNAAAPAYPTLFRPVFGFNSNGWPNTDRIFIKGYFNNGTDATTLLSLPEVDLSDPNSRLQMYSTANSNLGGSDFCLVRGTPVVIGARKGYPNFNEFAVQSLLSVTRRLEFVKTNATNIGPMNAAGRPLTWTNQSLILGMTNILGFEAWNSYTGAFPRALQLVATNVSDVTVGFFVNRHLTTSAAQFSATNFLLLYTNRTVNGVVSNMAASAWTGTVNPNGNFKSFFFTNAPQFSSNAAAGYAFATNYPPLPGFTNGGFAPASAVVPGLAIFNRTNGFPDLRLHITITNSIRYALIEPVANRVVDFVNLGNMIIGTNILAPMPVVVAAGKLFRAAHGLLDGMEVQFYTTGTLPPPLFPNTSYFVRNATLNDFSVASISGGAAIGLGFGLGSSWVIPPTEENLGLALGTGGTNNGGSYWLTTGRVGGVMNPTAGISNQIAMCLDTNISVGSSNASVWRQYSLNTPVLREIDRFRKWMGTTGVLPFNQAMNTNVTSIQSPFNPTRVVSLSATWEANDPLVHYTLADLENQFLPLLITNHPTRTAIAPPGSLYRVDFLINRFFTNYGVNFAFQPWGTVPDITRYAAYQNIANFRTAEGQGYYAVAPPAYDQRLKDAGVFRSDQWDFPQRKFANLGWLGRVHRGTPWQTFYLKSDGPNPTNWLYWAHSVETNPTNDWRLAEVFTAAIDSDATRGLLSVNQTNPAAWSALLSGTLVLTNTSVSIPAQAMLIAPASRQLTNIIGGLTNGLLNAKLSVPMWIPTANYSSNDVVAYWSAPYSVLPADATTQTKRYYRALNATNFVLAPNVSQNPFVQTSTPSFSYTYWTNVNYWAGSPVAYAAGDYVIFRDVSYISLGGGNSGFRPDVSPTFWEPAPLRSFTKLGYVLRTPELSVQSPYLNAGRPWQTGTAYPVGTRVYWQGWYYQAVGTGAPANQPPNPYLNYADLRTLVQTYWWPLESPPIARNGATVDPLTDVFIERIPQQTLGLMHLEPSPRVAIYAYGQSLKPAERGVYVGGGPYQGITTNYQVTGEQASRSVVRIDGLAEPGLLPPSRLPAPPHLPVSWVTPVPPLVFPRFIIESFKLTPADY